MPTHVLKVLYRLKSKGFMGLLVGGALRDLYRGKQPRDFDVATDAPLEEIRSLFRNSKTIGKRFPIVHAYFGNEVVEISSLKGEEEESGDALIIADARRRDFTVNAVFYNIDGFQVIDPLNALPDLKEGKVVCIGDPDEKFTEDAVRMLRALKLVAKQGMFLPDSLAEAIHQHAHGVKDIGPGRKYEELTRILLDPNGLSLLQLCCTHGLMAHLWPQGNRMLNKLGLVYFEGVRNCIPISFSRGSFAKHSHTHLWLKLYLDSPFFKASENPEDHKVALDAFLEGLAMPFRAPIVDTAVCVSQILLLPDDTPSFTFSKEVQRLLQFYTDHVNPNLPEHIEEYIHTDRRKRAGIKPTRKRKRRRRGGRRRRKPKSEGA